MCEGYWDVRLRRWVGLEEVEERELETEQEGFAIPLSPLVDTVRKRVVQLR
jgi:hypothetical protein